MPRAAAVTAVVFSLGAAAFGASTAGLLGYYTDLNSYFTGEIVSGSLLGVVFLLNAILQGIISNRKSIGRALLGCAAFTAFAGLAMAIAIGVTCGLHNLLSATPYLPALSIAWGVLAVIASAASLKAAGRDSSRHADHANSNGEDAEAKAFQWPTQQQVPQVAYQQAPLPATQYIQAAIQPALYNAAPAASMQYSQQQAYAPAPGSHPVMLSPVMGQTAQLPQQQVQSRQNNPLLANAAGFNPGSA